MVLFMQEKYQQSVYTLTETITAEDWNPDTIVARQSAKFRAEHLRETLD